MIFNEIAFLIQIIVFELSKTQKQQLYNVICKQKTPKSKIHLRIGVKNQ